MSSFAWNQRRQSEDAFGAAFESVSDLTGRIKRSLESDFGQVAVRGELSNVARPRSGHIYFTLKDELASIRAVMWKMDSRRVAFDLNDGLAVRAVGRLTVYAPRGEYQIVVNEIEPEGMGSLELAFRQRYARLALEGLFDAGRKRPLPRFPRGIVIVTSPTGAAVRDVLQVISRRWRCASVWIAPTRVQGVGADREVVAALELANRVAAADVIILARGGGSLEDLWTFNEESVVRAIVASRLPVISAVGHEIDVTLADLAADRRALTPSEAGEVCVPDAREVMLHLDRLADRIRVAGVNQLRDARARLDQLARRRAQAIERDLAGRRQLVGRLGASLEALNPSAVLARGYSLTFLADGTTLVRSADTLTAGDQIHTQFAAGRVSSRVE